MRARYYISFGGAYSEFFPSNEPIVSIEQEAGEVFFRNKIDRFKITKTKNSTIYATLLSWFYDPTKFLIDIKYRIQENDVTTYEFIGPILKGKINTEYGVYECNPDPDDNYRTVLNYYDRKFTTTDGADMIATSDVNIYVPLLTTGDFSNVDFDTFDDTDNDVTWDNSVGLTVEKARITQSATTNRIDIFITEFTGNDFYILAVDSGGTPISNIEVVTANQTIELTLTGSVGYVEIRSDAAVASGSFHYEIYTPIFHRGGATLEHWIDYIVNTSIGASLDVVSTYLWNDALGSDPPPDIDTYITANPAKDYVLEGLQKWNNLTVFRTALATDPKFEISLKDIMDILKIKLRAWWFIDEDGKFRIEHEKYIRDYTSQADLTSATYEDDRPEIDNKIYNYDFSNVYNTLNYKEGNEFNSDWIARPITFDPIATGSKTNEIIISKLTTDVGGTIDNYETIDASVVVLAACDVLDGGYGNYIPYHNSWVTAGDKYINAYLGWWYLFAHYWDYYAEAEDGYLNGTAHSFTLVKEYLKQENIKFHKAATIDWKKPFTLTGGEGWLTGGEYHPETGIAIINVGYNPYA